jgi:glucose 1-dehydrogenase
VTHLHDKTALITGGGRGIGRAIVLRLAKDGLRVAVGARTGEEVQETAATARASGASTLALALDVESAASISAAVERTVHELGPVDVLVNNAGVEKAFKLVDMPLDEWQRVIDVNLTGAFLCAREAARGMIEAGLGGVIVNVSSVHEQIPWEQFSHYCASKGGMKLFAESISKELAGDGIRVVNVGPGAILTPINQVLIDDARKREAVAAETPLGRIGRPEEIAAAISWLASAEADYVTGTTLFVDGGMTTYPNFT